MWQVETPATAVKSHRDDTIIGILKKHATPTALVFEAIFISIDISCLRHLRDILCLRHFTPMGFVRRGWCPHLPLNTFLE